MSEAAQTAGPAASARTPLCFIVDEEASIRHFVSLVLHGVGIDTEEFPDGASLRAALDATRKPDLVFHNISLESADAIESVVALGTHGFRGAIQLMSARGSAVLEHVKSVGTQHGLTMLPVLKKPFETEVIIKVIQELKLGDHMAGAARIGLDEALANKWLEFWYQPKIELRKKRLAGAETFARVRHPQHGILLPGSFMPGAKDSDLVTLAEQSIAAALKAGDTFARLGVSLRMSVNIPLDTLIKLPVPDLVRAHKPQSETWPGLVIDVTEDQIVQNLGVAIELTKTLAPHNVRLAVDDFGRGFSSLARLKELPFAEFKLDRAFVLDCGTDKKNAPLCKTVIDLAHNFGSVAVAIGIEKAADAVALVSMGCDYGQGFLLGQPMPQERFVSLLRQRAATQGKQLSPAAQTAPMRATG